MALAIHYTDVGACRSILEHGRVWLTDIRYLNDEHEYVNGENFIRQIFAARALADGSDGKSAVEFFEDCVKSGRDRSYTFVGSFSNRSDSLSQWRSYCPKSGGVALEFDESAISMKLHKCLYEDAEKAADANSLYDLCLKTFRLHGDKWKLFGTVWSNIAKFKHNAFVDEAERRVLIFQRRDQAATSKRLRFRTRENLAIPYMEFEVDLKGLRAIRVGPCAYPDLARTSLRNLVDALAFDSSHAFHANKPSVEVSAVPYRA